MKIVICGSRRFHDELRELGQKLNDLGHIVFEPLLNRNNEISSLPKDLKKYAFLGLTHNHFDLIKKADICFIFNKGGYMGNSATIELGYAVACGLPIYALEEDKTEPCRNVLFNFVVGNVENFLDIISKLK